MANPDLEPEWAGAVGAAGPGLEPELVIVPAHPRVGDRCQVEFEVRAGADGAVVLPVFSSVAALTRALGRLQPWVCVPLASARDAASRAGQVRLALDPVVGPGQRWQPASYAALAVRQPTGGGTQDE